MRILHRLQGLGFGLGGLGFRAYKGYQTTRAVPDLGSIDASKPFRERSKAGHKSSGCRGQRIG